MVVLLGLESLAAYGYVHLLVVLLISARRVLTDPLVHARPHQSSIIRLVDDSGTSNSQYQPLCTKVNKPSLLSRVST